MKEPFITPRRAGIRAHLISVLSTIFATGIVLALCVGCGPDPDRNTAVIELTGTKGMTVNGTYGDRFAKITLDSAEIPITYRIKDAVGEVYVSVVKASESGELKATISKGGEVVAESSTKAPFGMIDLKGDVGIPKAP